MIKIFKTILASFMMLIMTLFSFNAFSMDYSYNSSSNTTIMTGDIVDGDYNKFIAFLKTHKTDNIIITSYGGLFKEGEQIGIFVQDNNITVDARNLCFSTCVYIWLASGNKIASITDPDLVSPIIQIHLPYDPTTGKTDPDAISEASWYLGHIGLTNAAVHDIVKANEESLLFNIDPKSTYYWFKDEITLKDLRKK